MALTLYDDLGEGGEEEQSLLRAFNEPTALALHPCLRGPAPAWDATEPEEIIAEFTAMLRLATGDGAAKRRAGTKPSWKVDTSHEGAVFSHLTKWKRGELVDPDSGAHPLVHAAWRLLALAYQETHGPEVCDAGAAECRFPGGCRTTCQW